MVVDAGIKPELRFDIAAFVWSAGNSDHACPFAFGELAGDRSYRARGGRHDDGFTPLRPSYFREPDIGGEPRHAQHAECRRQRRLTRVQF